MAEILIKAVNATNPDATKSARWCYKRGDPVCVHEDGWSWRPTTVGQTSPKGLVYRGVWSPTAAYVVNDVVFFPEERLNRMVCIQANTGQWGASFWRQFSEAGTSEIVPPAQGGPYVIVVVPDVTVAQTRRFLNKGTTTRMLYRVVVDELSASLRNQLNNTGTITRTWTQIRGFIENKVTLERESGATP